MGNKIKNGPRPEMAEKWQEKWTRKWDFGLILAIFPFLRPFAAISGVGPFSIFFPIFPGFWLRAHFPFCERPLQSQFLVCKQLRTDCISLVSGSGCPNTPFVLPKTLRLKARYPILRHVSLQNREKLEAQSSGSKKRGLLEGDFCKQARLS